MTTHRSTGSAAAFGMFFLLVTACTNSGTETREETSADSVSVQMDSAQTRIENSAEHLEEKTKELEEAMEDLDTSTVTN